MDVSFKKRQELESRVGSQEMAVTPISLIMLKLYTMNVLVMYHYLCRF